MGSSQDRRRAKVMLLLAVLTVRGERPFSTSGELSSCAGEEYVEIDVR